jgi:predicted unusual protein kinase regulating ubiquinone biosynthesis (AarF/ABC1/UbiB family)
MSAGTGTICSLGDNSSTQGGNEGAVIKASHLGRYKDIALLLAKHRGAMGRGGDEIDDTELDADAAALASDLEEMGPTFVKLGQLLSTRGDLLPPPYLHALARLQDDVEPLAFEVVERTVSVELGVRMSKAFASFESTPIASASLGQVHRAALRDGRPVAVKVQRPDIRARIVDDMDAIEEIASMADEHTTIGRRMGFAEMVAEYRTSLLAELDYRKEAANLRLIGGNLADHDRIVVPRPIDDYSTGTVLTMDYVPGRSLTSIGPLGQMEIDGPALAGALFSAYLDQTLVHGVFHSDPHPGNVLVTDDGRLALIDLGQVGRISPDVQEKLIKLLLAISEGQGRVAAEVTVALGQRLEDFDDDGFRREAIAMVERNQGQTVGDVQAGEVLSELTQIAAGACLRLPSELTMLGKALLNLDEIARILDPTFEPNVAIQAEAAGLMRKKLVQAASPGSVMGAAMEAKEFAELLPGRINQVMDALAAGKLTLNVQGIDERDIMRSVQKLANRVTAGMVVAALVVGAALIMRIDTDAKLFGYPALAIVMFLIAAAAGIVLLVSIQLSDLPQRRHRRRRE